MVEKISKKERTKLLQAQLTTYYRERILDGRLSAGTRLPSDEELAALYQVSRDTVRQALALLADEGLIERVQGRGTFVCQPPSKGSPVIQPQQKQIGLILNRTMRTQLPMDLLVGVEQAAKSYGYNVSFTYTEGEQEQLVRDIALLRANHVSGIIIWPMSDATHAAAIQQLQAEHIPVVLMDRYFPGMAIDYVGSDNAGGGFRATEHLLILGHRRIGFVYTREETLQTTSVYERWQGYCRALQKYEVQYDETLVIPDVRQLPAGGHEGLVEFLQRPDRPGAIFAVNDYVALDILQAAKAIHLRVPEDLAVVGFDDMEFAAHVNPPLTTIKQQFIDIGLRAGTFLINRIEGMAGTPRHIELPTNLIIRDSCGVQLHVKKILSLSQEKIKQPLSPLQEKDLSHP